jgi:signal transduction histidine kinase
MPAPTFVVEDTGPGIASDQLPHVFERFYRGDPSRPRDGGAGLGLSIAHWVATVHGARIALGSAKGGGTRAEVVFPRAAGPSSTPTGTSSDIGVSLS